LGSLKKKRTKNDSLRDHTDGVDSWLLGKDERSSREFKVRIVERLTYLERRLNGQNNNSEEIPIENAESEEVAPCLPSELIQDEEVRI